MDVEYIRSEVSRIESMDNEEAHMTEDALKDEFIAMVAMVGTPELAQMAGEVMKTNQLKFSRWYA